MGPSWLIWFGVGVALAFFELLLPGFIVFFFGIGCWVTALVLLLGADLSVTWQLALFLSSSLLALILLRKGMMRIFKGTLADKPEQEFADFPLGQRVKVVRTIQPPDSGRIQHRGTEWDAVAEDTLVAGETVEIVRFADTSRKCFFVRKI